MKTFFLITLIMMLICRIVTSLYLFLLMIVALMTLMLTINCFFTKITLLIKRCILTVTPISLYNDLLAFESLLPIWRTFKLLCIFNLLLLLVLNIIYNLLYLMIIYPITFTMLYYPFHQILSQRITKAISIS